VGVIPLLPETVVEVTDFWGYYGGDLKRVRDEVEWINRTGGPTFYIRHLVATARVHVVVSERWVRRFEFQAFTMCSNFLVKVTTPFVEVVGWRAFNYTVNLRYATLGPDAGIKSQAACLSRSLRLLLA